MAEIAMAGNCLPGRASKKERTHARHNHNIYNIDYTNIQ